MSDNIVPFGYGRQFPLEPGQIDNPNLSPKSFSHAEVVMFWSAARDALETSDPEDLRWALEFVTGAMIDKEYARKMYDTGEPS